MKQKNSIRIPGGHKPSRVILLLIISGMSFFASYGQNKAYPSLRFQSGSWSLSNNVKAQLSVVSTNLKEDPSATITLTGYPGANKASQASCQKRVESIKQYLSEKEGISRERITTNCIYGGGNPNTVDIAENK